MSTEKKSNNWAGLVVVIVIVGIIGLILTQNGKKNDCEDRATAAAVDQYPINEYPDASERSRLQETYKTTYMESCN